MIKFIAAIDGKRGLANEHGLPWQGKLPTDVKQFRDKTMHCTVLMGYGTYIEFDKPLSDRHNYVATSSTEALRPGFEPVPDAKKFLMGATNDIWVIGGASLFASTLDMADELYLTRIDKDFHCTKFFPDFENRFQRIQASAAQTENSINFWFEVWEKLKSKS
jgi:dihydrofolate reductase